MKIVIINVINRLRSINTTKWWHEIKLISDKIIKIQKRNNQGD